MLIRMGVLRAVGNLGQWFWRSDILTGNQTEGSVSPVHEPFWRSDILTGNQTDEPDQETGH